MVVVAGWGIRLDDWLPMITVHDPNSVKPDKVVEHHHTDHHHKTVEEHTHHHHYSPSQRERIAVWVWRGIVLLALLFVMGRGLHAQATTQIAIAVLDTLGNQVHPGDNSNNAIRVNVVGGSGSVPTGSAGAPSASVVTVQGAPSMTPLLVNETLWNGTSWDNSFVSINQALISVSATTDVVIVAGSGSLTTRITKFDIGWDTTADISITQGTGTKCATSTVTLAGPYKNFTALFEDYTAVSALRNTVAGRDICLHFSTAVTGGGQVFYAQY